MYCHHSYLMLALGTIYASGGHIVAPRVEDIRVYLLTAPYQLRKKNLPLFSLYIIADCCRWPEKSISEHLLTLDNDKLLNKLT